MNQLDQIQKCFGKLYCKTESMACVGRNTDKEEALLEELYIAWWMSCGDDCDIDCFLAKHCSQCKPTKNYLPPSVAPDTCCVTAFSSGTPNSSFARGPSNTWVFSIGPATNVQTTGTLTGVDWFWYFYQAGVEVGNGSATDVSVPTAIIIPDGGAGAYSLTVRYKFSNGTTFQGSQLIEVNDSGQIVKYIKNVSTAVTDLQCKTVSMAGSYSSFGVTAPDEQWIVLNLAVPENTVFAATGSVLTNYQLPSAESILVAYILQVDALQWPDVSFDSDNPGLVAFNIFSTDCVTPPPPPEDCLGNYTIDHVDVLISSAQMGLSYGCTDDCGTHTIWIRKTGATSDPWILAKECGHVNGDLALISGINFPDDGDYDLKLVCCTDDYQGPDGIIYAEANFTIDRGTERIINFSPNYDCAEGLAFTFNIAGFKEAPTIEYVITQNGIEVDAGFLCPPQTYWPNNGYAAGRCGLPLPDGDYEVYLKANAPYMGNVNAISEIKTFTVACGSVLGSYLFTMFSIEQKTTVDLDAPILNTFLLNGSSQVRPASGVDYEFNIFNLTTNTQLPVQTPNPVDFEFNLGDGEYLLCLKGTTPLLSTPQLTSVATMLVVISAGLISYMRACNMRLMLDNMPTSVDGLDVYPWNTNVVVVPPPPPTVNNREWPSQSTDPWQMPAFLVGPSAAIGGGGFFTKLANPNLVIEFELSDVIEDYFPFYVLRTGKDKLSSSAMVSP